ncbi:MAG: hypothetical protein CSA22_08965 [Deltaproteobacteria bacterium]|nr:MAG: hypothetical protein CSA22_08965 [Deltaproteobacteria bacterium]
MHSANKYEALTTCLDQYTAMQHTHLTELQNNVMPDVGRMNFERSGQFKAMKTVLNALLKQIHEERTEIEIPFLEAVVRRLAEIKEQDNRITEIMTEHRDSIARHMKKLQRGRTAMHGYGQSISAYADSI